MQCVKADFPSTWSHANIYTLADLHIGDTHSIYEVIKYRIDEIKNDPFGLCILNGDLMNTALRNSVSDVYSEVMKPMDQIRTIVDLLRPIVDKIIGVTTGNHESRVYRNDGVDIMRIACQELGIENKYSPEGVLIFLRFGLRGGHSRHKDRDGKQWYTIYATHGSGGGRKEGAKAIRLADMASIVDADIYIHSHTHLPMLMKQMYYRTSVNNGSVMSIERLFVNTGATLGYGGYGQAQEYKPASLSTPVIHLDALKKLATATL